MKKLFIALVCFCSTWSFAQKGFYLQPEVGGGFSNAVMPVPSSWTSYDNHSVLSYQGQMDIGYRTGKWQFATGIGYLRTGVYIKNGSIATLDKNAWLVFAQSNDLPFVGWVTNGITDFNPHVMVPVKVGYEVAKLSNKLSFTPFIGAEFSRNMPRTLILDAGKERNIESKESFNSNCNLLSTWGTVQLNFDYRLSNRYDLSFGPSCHYMFTSQLNFAPERDYSVLLNLGVKYNFKRRDNLATSVPAPQPVPGS